jgi:hypothetical protein
LGATRIGERTPDRRRLAARVCSVAGSKFCLVCPSGASDKAPIGTITRRIGWPWETFDEVVFTVALQCGQAAVLTTVIRTLRLASDPCRAQVLRT